MRYLSINVTLVFIFHEIHITYSILFLVDSFNCQLDDFRLKTFHRDRQELEINNYKLLQT